jgi:hypothetical protein
VLALAVRFCDFVEISPYSYYYYGKSNQEEDCRAHFRIKGEECGSSGYFSFLSVSFHWKNGLV